MKTLVVWMGEFWKDSENKQNESRKKGPLAQLLFCAARRGRCKTWLCLRARDRYTMAPDENPVKPEDLAATIYYLLGISPDTEILNKDNRPLPIGGRVITDVIPVKYVAIERFRHLTS